MMDPYFFRKHTCGMLRRYLYASMQASRIACTLDNPIARGWVTSRPVRTFEDAVIFICDMEKCIKQLDSLDWDLLARCVLQEYTQPEAACLLGMSARTVTTKLPLAIDRLTEKLIETGILIPAPVDKAA